MLNDLININDDEIIDINDKNMKRKNMDQLMNHTKRIKYDENMTKNISHNKIKTERISSVNDGLEEIRLNNLNLSHNVNSYCLLYDKEEIVIDDDDDNLEEQVDKTN